MIGHAATGLLLHLTLLILLVSEARDVLRLPSDFLQPEEGDMNGVTRWAVLVAGSKSFSNYRHQADVCHAYQLLRRGGLRDENIIIFMYDDIADNPLNPRPGVIINHPKGNNVYEGVPKDYTGDEVNVNNFFAAVLGNKTALTGGSGKVVNSGPNDHIFIYYSDHGGPGVLGMPSGPPLYANDLVEVLKKKHASGTYKSMVIYIEACEAGSMFEGLLPEGLHIYATTASNAEEPSWCTYCPSQDPGVPPGYYTCLGDLYSVIWMQDSEKHNLRTETLRQQYHLVKKRISYASHAMQFGDLKLNTNDLFLYMGTNPANDNFTFVNSNSLHQSSTAVVNQRDADLLHFWHEYTRAPQGSTKKFNAQKQFTEVMSHRTHVDSSMKLVGKLLFGPEKGHEVQNVVRPAGHPLVDDWDCLKSLVRAFETHCGSLSQYGMKHMRTFANMCNAGIKKDQMAEAAGQACASIPSSPWSSLSRGFSA